MQLESQKQENIMRKISVEKINLGINTGEPGNKLEKAKKLLATISGMKTVTTKAKKRIPTWGLRPGLEIGCKVTVRGNKAEEILKQMIAGKNKTLKESNFDDNGNFSFGIHEYLDIPGVEYDAEIGIIGLEIAITLKRKGFRIRRRAVQKKPIPKSHKITKQDAIKFIKENYGVKIE